MGIGKTLVAATMLLVCLSPNLAAAQAANPAPAPAAPAAAAPIPIAPPSPEALKAAADFLAVAAPDSFNPDPSQSWPKVAAGFANLNLDKDTLAALQAQYESIQKQSMSELEKAASAVYASDFTVPELREMTAFYKTPTGQKALKEIPIVTAEYESVTQQRQQEVQAETFLAFQKILRARNYIK
jgi:hypothetical protein